MNRFAATLAAVAAFALALGVQAADEKRGQSIGDTQERSKMMPVPPNPKPPSPMSQGEIKKVEITLAPGKLHEECMDLQPGQQLRYEFDAPSRLDFNIHYHQGSEVVFPVERRDIASDKGVFEPAMKQHYCMMWSSAAKEPSALSYEFRVE